MAGACLNTMAILQAHQADRFRELDEGGGVRPDSIKKLCQAMDLCLHAIKETAHAVGHLMSALVATERHFWLNLSGEGGTKSIWQGEGQNIPP